MYRAAILVLMVCALMMLVPRWARASGRETIDLSRDWEFTPLHDAELTYPPADRLRWYPTDTFLFPQRGRRATALWYRKSFEVPEDFGGDKRVKLEFGGAKYTAIVYLNGEKIGSYGTGFVPFSVDATSYVRRGGTNQLLVAVGGAPFTLSREVANPPTDLDSLRTLGDIGLVPLGLIADEIGLWDGVKLTAYNPIHISDVFVQTSVRNQEISVSVTVSNESGAAGKASVSAEVMDGSQEALRLPEAVVEVEAGGKNTVTLRSKWQSPKLWFPDSPNLYDLKVGLKAGDKVVDEDGRRFGFREFWTDGPYFRLNGVEMKLRATATHFFNVRERGWDTKEGSKAFLEKLKERNFNVIRFHAQIWPAHMYDAADEAGFLAIPESPMWTQVARYAAVYDPRFWENAKAQLEGAVTRDRSHPSVVIWSVENEFLHMTGSDQRRFSTIESGVAKLGRFVKTIDPTRPILYSADLDPEGTADVMGLHYVVEYPNFNMVPNDFYWLNEPVERSPGKGLGLLHPAPWKWDRKKPLYIGEFAWLPFQTPDHLAGIIGDEVYTGDVRAKHSLAKVKIWEMNIEAFRYDGLSGMCPWTPFEQGGNPREAKNAAFAVCQRAFSPIAAFVKEYNTTFYGGATVRRTVTVYNDTLEPKELELQWSAALAGETEPFESGIKVSRLEPAELEHVEVSFHTPSVDKRTEAVFKLAVIDAGRTAFEESKKYSIFPRVEAAVAGKVLLYDAPGKTSELLKAMGIEFERAEAPLEPDANRNPVLVIGKDSLDSNVESAGDALISYVRSGGKLLILEQPAGFYQRLGFVPVRFRPGRGTTIAFPRAAGHPVLEGLTDEDLAFWGEDNVVAQCTLVEPNSGNFIPVADASDGRGLINALLLDVPLGKGRCILSTFNIHELSGSEPVADIIFARLIKYAFACEGKPRKAFLVGDSPQFAQALENLNVSFDERGELPPGRPEETLAIVSGDAAWAKVAADKDKLGGFLEGGGMVLAHRLSPDDAKLLSQALGREISVVKAGGEGVSLLRDRQQVELESKLPVSSGMSNRSLLWSYRPRGAEDVPEEFVVDLEKSDGAIALTRPAALAVLPVGKGAIVIDEVRWEAPPAQNEDKGTRYASILLTNLGAEIGVEKENAVYVDIASSCNRGFRDLEAGDGRGGWTDRGRDDIRFFPDPELGNWIPGMQRPVVQWERYFGGIPFRIVDPEENNDRSCVAVSTVDKNLPTESPAIAIGVGGVSIHFLVAAETEAAESASVGTLVFKTQDGKAASYEIVNGRTIADWRLPAGKNFVRAVPAWTGPNLVRAENTVYLYSITPATPFSPVESVTLRAGEKSTVLLLGITVLQERASPRGGPRLGGRPR